MLNFKTLVTAGTLVLLAACGGGGGKSGTSAFGSGVTTVVAGSVILTLDKSSVTNTDSTPVTAKVIVTDTNGQTLSNVPVTFSVSGARFTTTSANTGSDGSLSASVIFSSDKSNRIVDVTATAGGKSDKASFVVSGTKIGSTANPAIITPGSTGSIEFVLTDANSTPIPLTDIQISNATLGIISAKTDSAGKYTYSYTLPNTYASSDLVVNAAALGATQTQTVSVQLGSTSPVIPSATALPSTVSIEVNPSVIGTNPIGSPVTQSATVRFKAFGSNSLPLKNVRVSFDLAGDANGIGGAFSSGPTLLYTDSNGIATTTYTPGATASATEGLTIRACYKDTNFTPANNGLAVSGSAQCPNSQIKKVTVKAEALNVTLGPDDKIAETADGLRYVVKYVVQVATADGVAKSGVVITPTLDLLGFEKGSWVYSAGAAAWVKQGTTDSLTYPDTDVASIPYVGCRNEDRNRNGITDPSEDTDNDNILDPGEDTNGNGVLDLAEDIDADKVLEPRKSDAAVSLVSSSNTTDDTGSIALQVTYLKNVASWARIKLTVTGAVSGTEGKGTFSQVLPVPDDVIKKTATPAFATNPYGAASACSSH
jgi:hypothetical protein